jgi:hypothetical protein
VNRALGDRIACYDCQLLHLDVAAFGAGAVVSEYGNIDGQVCFAEPRSSKFMCIGLVCCLS